MGHFPQIISRNPPKRWLVALLSYGESCLNLQDLWAMQAVSALAGFPNFYFHRPSAWLVPEVVFMKSLRSMSFILASPFFGFLNYLHIFISKILPWR
jgi:hypothetical protein